MDAPRDLRLLQPGIAKEWQRHHTGRLGTFLLVTLADLLNTTYVSGTKLRTSQPPYRVGTVMLQVFHMRVPRHRELNC